MFPRLMTQHILQKIMINQMINRQNVFSFRTIIRTLCTFFLQLITTTTTKAII